MASNLFPIQSPATTVRPPSSTTTTKSDQNNTKNWWTPLFGWSSEPDYIDTNSTFPARCDVSMESDSVERRRTVRSSSVVSFSDEKAKKLRMMTVESTHDKEMYHSAIASRLASDFSHHR